jgi:NitT/TauT family transport system permease protein
MARLWRSAAFAVLLVCLWQGVVRLGIWPPILLPSPWTVARSLWECTVDGTIPLAVVASMGRMLIGYAIAVAVGLATGVATARWRLVHDTIGQLTVGLQSLPSVCWLPLALLWFGLSEKAVVFVVVMGATFSIAISVDDAIRNVPPLLLKAGRTLGARGLDLQRRVLLPAALPGIVSGMKLGWSFAWRSLMAGELLYSERGLGRVLMMGRDLGDMAQVVAAMLVILLLGLAVGQYCFGPAERAIARRWGLAGPA